MQSSLACSISEVTYRLTFAIDDTRKRRNLIDDQFYRQVWLPDNWLSDCNFLEVSPTSHDAPARASSCDAFFGALKMQLARSATWSHRTWSGRKTSRRSRTRRTRSRSHLCGGKTKVSRSKEVVLHLDWVQFSVRWHLFQAKKCKIFEKKSANSLCQTVKSLENSHSRMFSEVLFGNLY